jgi:hypothetical protein
VVVAGALVMRQKTESTSAGCCRQRWAGRRGRAMAREVQRASNGQARRDWMYCAGRCAGSRQTAGSLAGINTGKKPGSQSSIRARAARDVFKGTRPLQASSASKSADAGRHGALWRTSPSRSPSRQRALREPRVALALLLLICLP